VSRQAPTAPRRPPLQIWVYVTRGTGQQHSNCSEEGKLSLALIKIVTTLRFVSWDVTTCSFVHKYQRFKELCWLHLQDGCRLILNLPDYTASHSRIPKFYYSLLCLIKQQAWRRMQERRHINPRILNCMAVSSQLHTPATVPIRLAAQSIWW
jgi:hypothetical protein